MPPEPKVLFVDDEAPMREILTLFFQGGGINLTAVATGQEGMEAFCGNQFDLTILDLNLAGGDCLDVLNFIKDRAPKHPVIVFTGAEDDELFLKKHLLDRAQALVRKTSPLKTLLGTTQRLLGENAPR